MDAGTLRVVSLASSSKGNAIYLEGGGRRVLVDAGVSCKRLVEGLEAIQRSPQSLDAVIITHEHSDHISGLERLARLCPQVPLLGTAGTAAACREAGIARVEGALRAGDTLALGGLTLTPFETRHDANEPIGLRIQAGALALGLCTDLGCTPFPVQEALEGVHLLILEANYDERMLANGPYPGFLKRRVAGDLGHLSNPQARELLRRLLHPGLGAVMLAHLSEKNNRPEVALTTVGQALWDEPEVLLGVLPAQGLGGPLDFQARAGRRPACAQPHAPLWCAPWAKLFAAG